MKCTLTTVITDEDGKYWSEKKPEVFETIKKAEKYISLLYGDVKKEHNDKVCNTYTAVDAKRELVFNLTIWK